MNAYPPFFVHCGGGGPLMANAILNFHFDYLTPSLIFIVKYICICIHYITKLFRTVSRQG